MTGMAGQSIGEWRLERIASLAPQSHEVFMVVVVRAYYSL